MDKADLILSFLPLSTPLSIPSRPPSWWFTYTEVGSRLSVSSPPSDAENSVPERAGTVHHTSCIAEPRWSRPVLALGQDCRLLDCPGSTPPSDDRPYQSSRDLLQSACRVCKPISRGCESRSSIRVADSPITFDEDEGDESDT